MRLEAVDDEEHLPGAVAVFFGFGVVVGGRRGAEGGWRCARGFFSLSLFVFWFPERERDKNVRNKNSPVRLPGPRGELAVVLPQPAARVDREAAFFESFEFLIRGVEVERG